MVKQLSGATKQARAEGKKEMEKEMKEEMEKGKKKAYDEGYSQGYDKAGDELVDQVEAAEVVFKRQQHAESYALGYCKVQRRWRWMVTVTVTRLWWRWRLGCWDGPERRRGRPRWLWRRLEHRSLSLIEWVEAWRWGCRDFEEFVEVEDVLEAELEELGIAAIVFEARAREAEQKEVLRGSEPAVERDEVLREFEREAEVVEVVPRVVTM
ncbi:hypothetical protein RHGRI_014145 [Rhododendron griersonianum]|uniref:Late embryogenesis abundant protein n=1 Tax=Rhododendron griersonianum TaxID=479676 RepID=A0AAV6K8J5_9ERIC|nr:hypothetical protein RHGRI_014145 [Rhododendron griersonianum]